MIGFSYASIYVLNAKHSITDRARTSSSFFKLTALRLFFPIWWPYLTFDYALESKGATGPAETRIRQYCDVYFRAAGREHVEVPLSNVILMGSFCNLTSVASSTHHFTKPYLKEKQL